MHGGISLLAIVHNTPPRPLQPRQRQAKMAPNEPVEIVTGPGVLEKELGPGPMRFAPKGERSIQEQREALDEAEKKCCDYLKKKWQHKYPELPFSDEMLLRFARCSPGSKKFNELSSWKVMKKYDRRFLGLTAEGLEGQLLTKVRAFHASKKTRFSCLKSKNLV